MQLKLRTEARSVRPELRAFDGEVTPLAPSRGQADTRDFARLRIATRDGASMRFIDEAPAKAVRRSAMIADRRSPLRLYVKQVRRTIDSELALIANRNWTEIVTTESLIGC